MRAVVGLHIHYFDIRFRPHIFGLVGGVVGVGLRCVDDSEYAVNIQWLYAYRSGAFHRLHPWLKLYFQLDGHISRLSENVLGASVRLRRNGRVALNHRPLRDFRIRTARDIHYRNRNRIVCQGGLGSQNDAGIFNGYGFSYISSIPGANSTVARIVFLPGSVKYN